MSTVEDVLNLFKKLTPLQRKAIAGILIAGGGFWGGIKFCDVKIKAQIGSYEIKIQRLEDGVKVRDNQIADHLKSKEDKMKEAQIAKEESIKAHALATDAEKRYRMLVAQATKSSEVPEAVSVVQPTVVEVAKACDEVIEKKNGEIKLLNASNSACFDANAAANRAILDLQANQRDLNTVVDFERRINGNIRKELESQKRRKWLYFAGGIILGAAADKALRK